ncbi:hypothetical protein [Campylobacter helveticus]|uniref:hypothetical protein n=1 Tax=Campylobacter helveticus TaxID=28898 RepID=UPI0022EAFB44|nr:hypothetical protein [Campylobacter helveticus]
MMDTELGILIRTLTAIIGLMVLAYIMCDYHSQVKEYLKKRKQKKKELEKTKKD